MRSFLFVVLVCQFVFNVVTSADRRSSPNQSQPKKSNVSKRQTPFQRVQETTPRGWIFGGSPSLACFSKRICSPQDLGLAAIPCLALYLPFFWVCLYATKAREISQSGLSRVSSGVGWLREVTNLQGPLTQRSMATALVLTYIFFVPKSFIF